MTLTSLVSTERTASWMPSRTRSKNDAISRGRLTPIRSCFWETRKRAARFGR